jgi:adenosylhomocysteine nucleosidase
VSQHDQDREVIGILGAMTEEVRLIGEMLEDRDRAEVGGRVYERGGLGPGGVVVAISGFGKVSAASTVTTMLDAFAPGVVLFTGVAGALDPSVGRGDVVVAEELAQHDFDASPIFPRFVIPSLQVERIPADPTWTGRLADAAKASGAVVHRGLVVSGDRFIDGDTERAELRSLFPGALAVEMEGAAVAQVCAERRIPFAVVRAISDTADEQAAGDFLEFVEQQAAPLLAAIIERGLKP